MIITVGISEMCVSKNPGDIIVTHALGSCIGLAVHDPVARVGGLLHYMLPLSKFDSDIKDINPCMYGNTGIPALFNEAFKHGAKKETITVVMAGGADILKNCNYFNIGTKNIAIARKMIRKIGIRIAAENTGGAKPRTLYLEIGTGKTWMTIGRERTDLI